MNCQQPSDSKFVNPSNSKCSERTDVMNSQLPAATRIVRPSDSNLSERTTAMNVRRASYCLAAALVAFTPMVPAKADWVSVGRSVLKPNLSVRYLGTAQWYGTLYARFEVANRSGSWLSSIQIREKGFSPTVATSVVRTITVPSGETRVRWVPLGNAYLAIDDGYSASVQVDPYYQVSESNEWDNYASVLNQGQPN